MQGLLLLMFAPARVIIGLAAGYYLGWASLLCFTACCAMVYMHIPAPQAESSHGPSKPMTLVERFTFQLLLFHIFGLSTMWLMAAVVRFFAYTSFGAPTLFGGPWLR